MRVLGCWDPLPRGTHVEQQGDVGIPSESPPQGHHADRTRGWGVPQFAGVCWCAEAVEPAQRVSPRLQALPMHMPLWAHLPIALPQKGAQQMQSGNHKVEMRFWWKKQP